MVIGYNFKVVGCFKTVDNGEQDDKILVVPYFYNYSRKKDAKHVKKAYKFLTKYKYPFQKNTIVDKKFYSDAVAKALIEKAVSRVNPKSTTQKITLS